jgi:hypothetical protein
MDPRPVGRGQPQLLDVGLASDLRAPGFGQGLTVEDQRILQEINGERHGDRHRQDDLQQRRAQALRYSSAPVRTNSTDFSCMPLST